MAQSLRRLDHGPYRKKNTNMAPKSRPASTVNVSLELGIDFSGGISEKAPVDMVVDLSTGQSWEIPRAIRSIGRAQPAGLRQLMVLMERPFFALGKQRLEPIEYSSRDQKVKLSVRPGPGGVATIWDADLLMFLVDHLAQAPIESDRSLLLKGSAYFEAVGLKRDGDQYRRLAATIERLRTTTVTTNLGLDGKPGPVRTFAWINEAVRCDRDWKITVSDWVAERARSKFMLNISPDYFGLGGFDRFLYLTARKQVGREPGKVFAIKVSKLWERSGSASEIVKFRYKIKRAANKNELPEYWLEWKDDASRDGLLLIQYR